MNPLFSIIVPVYKAEAYLRQCVDSVLAQTCGDFEVILVDDGSPDGSGAICDEYAARDDRVKVIHKENGGVTSARTVGTEAATGEYVLFLDSDDYLDAPLLAQLSELLHTHQPDAILFDGIRFGGKQERYATALEAGLYEGTLGDSLILNGSHQPVISYGVTMKLLPREAYLRFQRQVPPGLYKGEDMAVSVPLLAACRRVFVSHICGYYYRDTPGSVMNSFRSDEWQQIVLLSDHLEGLLPQHRDRIDAFAVQQMFDFADRAMSRKDYRRLAATAAQALLPRLRRARSKSPRFRERLVFWLTRHRCFGVLWLLRKLKPRK